MIGIDNYERSVNHVFDLDGSHTSNVGMYKKTTSDDSEYNQSESATGCCRVQQNAYASNYFLSVRRLQWHPHIDHGSTLGILNLTSVRKGAGD